MQSELITEVLPGQPTTEYLLGIDLTTNGRVLPSLEELRTPSAVGRLAVVVLEPQLLEQAADFCDRDPNPFLGALNGLCGVGWNIFRNSTPPPSDEIQQDRPFLRLHTEVRPSLDAMEYREVLQAGDGTQVAIRQVDIAMSNRRTNAPSHLGIALHRIGLLALQFVHILRLALSAKDRTDTTITAGLLDEDDVPAVNLVSEA
jgi:hypothetical protein